MGGLPRDSSPEPAIRQPEGFPVAVDPIPLLATFAAIIGLGFLGYLLFERTRVTDVLILIGFGILVGPIFGIFDVTGFQEATPLVGTLALIIIMFDGGLGINIKDLLSGIARSTILAVVGFTLTSIGVAAVGHYWLDLPWLTAVLLGFILGGTSGVIIIPVITRTSAKPGTRVLLSVESALTDVLSVIAAVTLITIISTSGGVVGAGEASSAVKNVASQFSNAIILGLVAGVVWLRTLKALQRKKYSYMITLAATLGLYVGAEAMGGNGAIAVLIFGIVLGNGFMIMKKFDLEGLEFSDAQRQFQGEIAFLVRAFFFVYLGVLLDPSILSNPAFLITGGLILGTCLVARFISVTLATWKEEEVDGDRGLMAFLLPRGLAAAVLAGLPMQAGIAGTENFVAYAFITVASTNLLGMAAVLVFERRAKAGGRVAAPTADGGALAGSAPSDD